MIIENFGSVCSGGRYENLATYYTDKKLPGVGISIGLTRLFYQLKEAGVDPTLIRLSIGLENPDDLIKDIEEALKY